MKTAFLLSHVRGTKSYDDGAKILGIFSSEKKAIEAINTLKDQSGFKDYPDGFFIDCYVLNELQWTTGFTFSDD